jgi:hypothetical protein
MSAVLRIAGAMIAALMLLGNSACFAACAVESCQTQAKKPPCHKHKPAKSSSDSACSSRTVIAPIPFDAALAPPAESAIVVALAAPALDAPLLAIDAVLAPDPPGPPLILRV